MPTTPQLNLVARDFDGIRRVLESYIKVKFPDDWKDFQSTGVASAMLDVISYTHAQRAFYYDRLSMNSFLVTADQIEAVKALTKQLGYTMRPATSASVPVELSPSVPQAAPITIPKGTRLTVGDLVFEAAEDLIIPAGRSVYPEVSDNEVLSFVEGETIVTSFVSDGSINQKFPVGRGGVIDGSLVVKVDDELWEEAESLVIAEGDAFGADLFIGDGSDTQVYQFTLLNVITDLDREDKPTVIVSGIVWTQVSTFTGGAREYRVTIDTNGVTQVVFGLEGDNSAPLNGDTIDISYIVSGAQKRYEAVYDAEDEPTIFFGDDTDGVIPTNNATITVEFRVGGGVKGNIARNLIDTNVNGELPNSATIAVNVKNREKGSGGEPPESIELAKVRAPLFSKALNRAVTQDDFTTLAATFRHPNFGAPSHARARLSQKAPELNLVKVAVWSRDNSGNLSTASSALKASMKKFLDSKRTITTYIEMEDGTVIYFDMEITVIVQNGYSVDATFSLIRQEVTAFFNSANVLPGKDLAFSILYEHLQNLAGVQSLVIKSVQGSILQTFDIGTGDGTNQDFAFNIVVPDGSEVAPFSVKITAGASEAIDDGAGSFSGDVDDAVASNNVINYLNGEGTVRLDSAPAFGIPVSLEARTLFFAATVDTLDTTVGGEVSINEKTVFSPVRKRTPIGRGSNTYARIANELRVGSSNNYQGKLTPNVTSNTVQIIVPATGTGPNGYYQIKIDEPVANPSELWGWGFINGTGAGIAPYRNVGSINKLTGEVSFKLDDVLTDIGNGEGPVPPYQAQPPLEVLYESDTTVIQMPEEDLPLVPGRLYFIGGKDPEDISLGTPPAGHTGQLEAYDDGEGNIVGDVLSVGTINYETGLIQFTWNTTPPKHGTVIVSGPRTGQPYPSLQLHFDPLGQPFNGVRKEFDFVIAENTAAQVQGLDFSTGTTPIPSFVVGELITQNTNVYTVVGVTSANVYSVQPFAGALALNIIDAITGDKGGGGTVNGIPSTVGVAESWTGKFDFMQATNLSSSALYAAGRLQLPLHKLSTDGVVFDDAFDNSFDSLNGLSLDSEGDNYIDYSKSKGKLTLKYAPIVPLNPLFAYIYTCNPTNVAWTLLAGLVWFVKTPGFAGHDQYLFADHRGHLFGSIGSQYPASRLDHDVGKLVSDLALALIAGRVPKISYDAALKSGADDVPIDGDQVSALGRLDIIEKEVETNL